LTARNKQKKSNSNLSIECGSYNSDKWELISTEIFFIKVILLTWTQFCWYCWIPNFLQFLFVPGCYNLWTRVYSDICFIAYLKKLIYHTINKIITELPHEKCTDVMEKSNYMLDYILSQGSTFNSLLVWIYIVLPQISHLQTEK
jgi:hypothetical protein